MPSLTNKDRVSLCLFTYEDGRRCRTPRISSHPHFCFYHAQKETQAQAADTLAKDLAAFFSGDYLSACDLSTAMARLIPAVIRGDIKPRLARTVAYMMQGLIQTVHLAKDEYINAFGTEGWRKAVRKSVNVNYDYRFPPDRAADEPESHQPPQPSPTQPPPQSPTQTAPQTPVGAGLARSDFAPAPPNQPNTATPPPQPRPQPRPPAPNRDPYVIHFETTTTASTSTENSFKINTCNRAGQV